jgi:hypothetical protein
MFYGKWVKMCKQKSWLLHHDNTTAHISFFAREFLTKNNITVVPQPPYFSASPNEDKMGQQR